MDCHSGMCICAFRWKALHAKWLFDQRILARKERYPQMCSEKGPDPGPVLTTVQRKGAVLADDSNEAETGGVQISSAESDISRIADHDIVEVIVTGSTIAPTDTLKVEEGCNSKEQGDPRENMNDPTDDDNQITAFQEASGDASNVVVPVGTDANAEPDMSLDSSIADGVVETNVDIEPGINYNNKSQDLLHILSANDDTSVLGSVGLMQPPGWEQLRDYCAGSLLYHEFALDEVNAARTEENENVIQKDFWDDPEHIPSVVDAATGFEDVFPCLYFVPPVPMSLRSKCVDCEKILDLEVLIDKNLQAEIDDARRHMESTQQQLSSSSLQKVNLLNEASADSLRYRQEIAGALLAVVLPHFARFTLK
jgi:hypothetical protein